jgi:hypothetical protein
MPNRQRPPRRAAPAFCGALLHVSVAHHLPLQCYLRHHRCRSKILPLCVERLLAAP